MEYKKINSQVHTLMNIVGLAGMLAVLTVAIIIQITKSELPCPLCLLQRAGLIMTGLGFMFNLSIGIRKKHYAMMITGCLLTGGIAARQVLLHILPGDAGYGSTFLGLHFYTWSLIVSFATLIYISLMLLLPEKSGKIYLSFDLSTLSKTISILFALIILANLVSTFLECGTGQCAENPETYLLLKKLHI
ncbi:disulfide bond formation protein B [Pantoea sp. JZ2]|uniref:disulfide bond formation protein B n=1 Tax=Pantoea sp. JZ2 TaxID=2654189 RepID=UPI002B476FDA|nr:disulfide bond formation protein B [Pantoea sp. JZ2]WRH11774.1 disulfide bond formation protein B [Pantoea sp. JZ2]